MPVTAGMRFGNLVAIERVGVAPDKHVLWKCVCDCGSEVVRQSNNLQSAAEIKSCGCIKTGANRVHGMHRSPTYSSWQASINRCHNKNSKDYKRYGAAGIQVCERWRNSFASFFMDMGERPAGTTLDRWPNKSGNYEPGNCRWASPREQALNKECATFVIFKGDRVHISSVAAYYGISLGAAHLRLKRGKLNDCVLG